MNGGGDKQPFAIACADGLTVMAGLWEKWRSPAGEKINSCTIITTEANELLAPLHNRMPVIIAPEDWPAWLGEREADQNELRAMLKPALNDLLHRKQTRRQREEQCWVTQTDVLGA
jgi:putative SOS response-associated peptidase YedK